MKYWLRQLPLEVWVDIFSYPWISRKKLDQLVDKIGSRKFAEAVQFYLHDWGKRKLKTLCFEKKNTLDIPRTPLPQNIRSFSTISISHFDARTIDFLQQIRPLLTANDVKLQFYGMIKINLENLRIILVNLLPILDGIHTLFCYVSALPIVKQCIGEKLANVKVLKILKQRDEEFDEATLVNFIMNWLTDGNGPKLCKAGMISAQLVVAIQEEFLAAKTACTFTVTTGLPPNVAEFHLENNIGEQLHGEPIPIDGYYGDYLRITRHQTNSGTELQEWIKQNQSWNRGQIEVYQPTIGLIDAPEEMELKGDQQPSSSKKARIS